MLLVTRVRSKRTASLSVQLVAWIAPPSIWFATPSGLITRPTSTAIDQPPHADLALGLDLGDDRAVGAEVLVAREADAVAARLAPLPLRPSGAAAPRASITARARGSDEVAQAVRDRIVAAARAASSSMNDSIANTLANAPSERSAEVRSGIASSRWLTTRRAGKS